MTKMVPAGAVRAAVALLASIAVVAAMAGTAAGAVTTKTSFEANYEYTGLTNGGFGSVHCTGHRQVNEKGYAAKGWPTDTRDVEHCRSTSPTGKLIALTGGETGEWFPGASGWNSDYDEKAAVSAAYTVSANDKVFNLVAYY